MLNRARYVSRDEFEAWLASSKSDVYVHPFDVEECHCGDVNCQGWRLVPARSHPPASASLGVTYMRQKAYR